VAHSPTSPPRRAVRLPQGITEVAVEGTVGCPVSLETSTDLDDWRPIRTEVLPFVYQELAFDACYFYRARLLR
jgi:hypothetical protein